MDWEFLVNKALEARDNAYVPYSNFRVGAAVLTVDEKIFTGCNVENSSYGATICAERTAIVKAVSAGESELIAIAIASDSSSLTFPCGICRQVISEFANEDTKFICSNKNGEYKIYNMDELLPHAFSKDDLGYNSLG
ncbi:MAG: cytidine deaminase [Clostridiaceae bacterium]|nr:cytidine deaminase [Clostridiaceae bacterium]